MSEPLPIVAAPVEFSTYAYSYPHKLSYRPLEPAVKIEEAWRNEDVRRLSLYVHIPFCEMRCGFCNLFTQSLPLADVVAAYLATLERQMRVVRAAVPEARLSQLAVGGGTPTFLSAAQLGELFRQLEATFDQRVRHLAASVEVSPATATPDRLEVLAGFGVERVSIGIQSFDHREARQIGRPQRISDVHQALGSIRGCGFPVLNIDLIYGGAAQTRESWLASLGAALEYGPEELYLYPLYVRPQTGLGRAGRRALEHRTDLYAAACEFLFERGYAQASLRCFRLPRESRPKSYACQRDGMIGLGCGARSYTTRLHYSGRFAVELAEVRVILGDWIAQTDQELALATHGIWLSLEEQRRRFVILSLLQAEGLDVTEFRVNFPESAVEEFPEISSLIERGWLVRTRDRYRLTASGLEHSDTVGPLLYSQPVRDRLRDVVTLPTM